jgi:HEAT repeat protein
MVKISRTAEEKIIKIIEKLKHVNSLIKVLKYKRDPSVRRSAAKALGRIGDKRAVEPLIQALKDENYCVREEAAWALGDIGDTRAVEPLIQSLKEIDTDRDVRHSAAGALGRIGDKRAVEPLLLALKDKNNQNVQRQAAWSLGQIRDERAIKPLILILKDADGYENWCVRYCAVRALRQMQNANIAEHVIYLLKDEVIANKTRNLENDAAQRLFKLLNEFMEEEEIKRIQEKIENQ